LALLEPENEWPVAGDHHATDLEDARLVGGAQGKRRVLLDDEHRQAPPSR
jgi:hypothetical protein